MDKKDLGKGKNVIKTDLNSKIVLNNKNIVIIRKKKKKVENHFLGARLSL